MTGTIKARQDLRPGLREICCKSLIQFQIGLSLQIRWVGEPLRSGSGTKIGVLTRMHAAGDRQPTSPVSWIEKKNTFPEAPTNHQGCTVGTTSNELPLLPQNTYPRNARSGCCRVTRRHLCCHYSPLEFS